MTSAKQIFRHAKGDSLDTILKRNAEWARRTAAANPQLFPTNAQGQSPEILWLGCCDSRAGDACLDLLPGEAFVHRNIANVVSHGDLSSLSVLHFAVDVLKVNRIIVCGHYDCGGIWTSLSTKKLGGEMDTWLRQLKDVKAKNAHILNKIENVKDRCDKLVELNVVSQVHNLKRNDRVMAAIKSRGLQVDGLVYDVSSGLLNPVEVPEDEHEEHFTVDHNPGEAVH